MRRLINLFTWITAFGLLAIGLTSCKTKVDGSNSAGVPLVTKSAQNRSPSDKKLVRFPEVNLRDLETGEQIKFSDLKKPKVITFWASWCSTCRKEYPLWRSQEFADKIIGINVQDASASEALRKSALSLMKDNGTTFPSYIDSADVLSSKLGIIGLPVTIVVNSKGDIVKRKDGLISKRELLEFSSFN
ncbi:MAG: TlpA family protein disulfide reductase [Actinomycetales bacterium]|nr:TlpA family protein disulfide reductase [Actinomycetales bacterium]